MRSNKPALQSQWSTEEDGEGENPVYYVLGQSRAGQYLSLRSDSIPRWERLSGDGSRHDHEGETQIPKMAAPMKKAKLPKTDSIEKLARFWDRHDLTDFDDELVEVDDPVFVRETLVTVPLEPREAKAVERR